MGPSRSRSHPRPSSRCIKEPVPGCRAEQLSAIGKRDFETPNGIRIRPALPFLRSCNVSSQRGRANSCHQEHDLLSDERIKILRSWRSSGFSIDNDLYLYPSDTQALETLSRYIVRCPVSLRRLQYDKKSNYVLYQPKSRIRKAESPRPTRVPRPGAHPHSPA